MNTSKMIRNVLTEAARGERHPLMGLIDWLTYDKGYSVRRIIRFSDRTLGIPRATALKTLREFLR